MYIKIALLFMAFLLMACSEPGSGDINLELDKAVVILDDQTFAGTAEFGMRTLAETEYEQISLLLSDSTKIDILNENFEEAVAVWDGESFEAGRNMVFMSSRSWGGGFAPMGGYLIIKNRSDEEISGKFDLVLYTLASSCYRCPEDVISVSGYFKAGIN